MNFKESLKEQAKFRYDQNYSKVEELFNHNLSYMNSLTFIKFEILNCIILDYNNASITLTNHFVERMLKLSLLQHETKNITFSEPEKYSKVITHAHQQYDHLKLHETLKHNRNKKLITKEEFEYLNNIAKEFRDSYSHAQIGKINKKQPKKFSGHMFSFSDVKDKLVKNESNFITHEIELSTLAPTFVQLYQNISSRDSALEYFTNIYKILINIEKRLESI